MPTSQEYEQENEQIDSEQALTDYIECNWRDLAKAFIALEQAEFRNFCRKDMEMTQ